jgi:hypothetical protein
MEERPARLPAHDPSGVAGGVLGQVAPEPAMAPPARVAPIAPAAPSPDVPASQAVRSPGLRRAVLYPDLYPWYVLLASLDIMLTWVVLHLGGRELNHVADWVLNRWDLPGMVIFKFSLVTLVVVICEVVGHVRGPLGRKLAEWAVAVTAIPVVVAAVQLFVRLVVHGAEWEWDLP